MALSVKLSPKQRAAIDSRADIVVFGGGNGPGKTFALQMLPLLPEYLNTPGCQSVIFAESNVKLEMAGGLVDKCRKWYAQAHPAGLDGYRQTPKKRWSWATRGGGTSTIDLSFVGEPGQWDAMEAAVICIDQVEQVEENQFFSVIGRNRTTCGARPRVFVTANPPEDGREHWLTRMLTRGGWVGEDGFPIQEMSGGTFTISNGGTYGSLLSTPIINPPQSGILGMHKIQDRPMAVDGQVVIRPMMYLALSYDHRLIDGKGAVTFLVTLKEFLENPEKLGLDF